MQLKNHQITLGELADYPPAWKVLQKYVPAVAKHKVVGAARTITLEQVLGLAQSYQIPKILINEIVKELERA